MNNTQGNTQGNTQVSEAQVNMVRGKIAELQNALDESLPGFPHILRDIHNLLREEEEVVTILKEEEIAVIVKGLETHANIVVTPAKAAKASRAKKAALKNITAADL